MWSRLAEPPFKSTKLLAGRFLVADSMTKGYDWQRDPVMTYSAQYPGFGANCHRDSYNVLYGDNRCAGYGDPQQRFIWWPAETNLEECHSTEAYAGANYSAWPVPINANRLGLPTMFHMLDVAAGVDLGAQMSYY